MPRVLILGATGMLGHVACRTLAGRFEVHAACRAEIRGDSEIVDALGPVELHDGIDGDSPEAWGELIERCQPDVVLNCVGVIKQRPEGQDPVSLIRINSLFPHLVAAWCDRAGARMIQVSTDCVFSGRRGMYTEEDIPDPVDTYGRSKLLGEVGGDRHLTIRTSIIGPELRGAFGLLEWARSQKGRTVRGFAKAVFSGLTTRALSELLVRVIENRPELSGLFHLSSAPINKFDLLNRLNEHLGLELSIERDETVEIDRSLDGSRFRAETQISVPTWDEMLSQLAGDLIPQESGSFGSD